MGCEYVTYPARSMLACWLCRCVWLMCRHSESSRDAAWSSVILAQITQLSAICSDSDGDNVYVSLIEVSRTAL